MAEHRLVTGNVARAMRALPFAQNKLKELKRLVKRSNVHHLAQQFTVLDVDVIVHAGAQDWIRLDAVTGGPWVLENVIVDAFNDLSRFYTYDGSTNESQFFLEVDMADFPTIQALTGYVGIGGLTVWEDTGVLTISHGLGLLDIILSTVFEDIWTSGNFTPGVKYRETDDIWTQETIDTDINLSGVDFIDISGDSAFLNILYGGQTIYREEDKEWTYAWSSVPVSGVQQNRKAYIVSRDKTFPSLDWDVEFVIDSWTSGLARPRRVWVPSYDSRAPSFNPTNIYMVSETVKSSPVGNDVELWDYDRDTGLKTLEHTLVADDTKVQYEWMEVFLTDHSGITCGYSTIEVGNDGTVALTGNVDNSGSPTGLLRYYTAPVADLSPSSPGGLANTTLAFTIDMEQFGPVSFNFSTQTLGFWRISGQWDLEGETPIDNNVYGLWILGGFAPENWPSLIARWDRINGLSFVHKEFDFLTDGTFQGNEFHTEDKHYDMLTDYDELLFENPDEKDVDDGPILLADGSPAVPPFVNLGQWESPRYKG